jgi:hypothetical protein
MGAAAEVPSAFPCVFAWTPIRKKIFAFGHDGKRNLPSWQKIPPRLHRCNLDSLFPIACFLE